MQHDPAWRVPLSATDTHSLYEMHANYERMVRILLSERKLPAEALRLLYELKGTFYGD